MSDTTMKQAMRKAGMRTPGERLHEIALRQMVAHAGSTDDTKAAIWTEVQQDRTLLVALFQHEWERAINALLYRVRSDINHQQAFGKLTRKIEREAAKVVDNIRQVRVAKEYEIHRAETERLAREAAEYREYLRQWQESRIGDIKINGTPIWQNTVGTVRVWLDSQKRRLRTVEMLIEGLPDDGRPIEYYRKPEEVAAIWAAAA